ncbi:conjugal transfer protein TraG N-terminal domain-containing protein [Thermodesulfovibrio thiophilus]|uniref:conjugal transfer protein TraG N-terminal domain-containing protein n=1 Tax=Thermodesulfovibrio thiophilus TaxID=340095 RepID=UPI0003FC6550|nr:conjugal transfer protein TraG N-terminal domain-containing protein [Thermodesulfovibrio thiophilus]
MRKLFVLLILILPFVPAIASAATWEYITYGGYDACLSAWKKVALIFSDDAYKGLFITAVVLGAGFAFISAYIRIATGVKSGIHSWFVYMLLGTMIYAAFIVPKDKLVIYDQTLNRGPETVDDVPRGIATLAGLLNKIEVGFIDIVSTSADPASDYRTNAGGTGFLLLDINPAPASLRASLQRYVKDCVLAETVRPGTQLNPDAISDGRTSWDTIITESQNPSLYTVYYTEQNPAGETKTCQEAGLALKQALNAPQIQQTTTEAVCYSNSFSGGTGLNACRNLLDSTVQMIFQTGDTGLYIRQSIFADAMMEVITSNSTTEAMKAMATAKTQSNLIGMAAHANSWIPVIKETMKAVAISLVPFMALIAVTPLAGRAISLIAGMFLWVTVWGVVDAILHSMAVDLAKQASDSLKVNGNLGMGLVQLMMLPQDYLPKVAATFGAIRWSGLMLSTVMTGMLVKFGGAALGMLAGSITGVPQSSGAQYGSMVTNPGGVMSGEILPAKTYANAASMQAAQGGFKSLMEGSAKMQAGQLSGQARTGNMFGGESIAQATATQQAFGIKYQAGAQQQIMENTSAGDYGMLKSGQVARGIGEIQGTLNTAKALGYQGNNEEMLKQYTEFTGRGSIIGQAEADALNKQLPGPGKAIKPGMKLTGFGVNSDGKVGYITAQSQDGNKSVTYKDGMLIEKEALHNAEAGGFTLNGTAERIIDAKTGQLLTSKYDGIIKHKNGRQFEGSLVMDSNGKIVNVKGERGQQFNTKDIDNASFQRLRETITGSRKDRYHETVNDYYGQNTVIGNDTWRVMHGEEGIIEKSYLDMFTKHNTPLAEEVMSTTAKQINEYFKHEGSLRDYVKSQGGVDLSATPLGKILGIKAGMSFEEANQKVRDFNFVRHQLYNKYEELDLNRSLTAQEKARTLEKEISSIFAEGRNLYNQENNPSGPGSVSYKGPFTEEDTVKLPDVYGR